MQLRESFGSDARLTRHGQCFRVCSNETIEEDRVNPNQKKTAKMLHGLRRQGSRAKAVAAKVNTTLGDLIVAAFDTVGNEAKAVAELMSSSDMRRAIRKRIVFT